MVTIIDADGAVLGRMCSMIAKRLLNGEEIAVVNTEKAIISGKKRMIIEHYTMERQVGTYRKGPYYPRMPDRIVKRTIRGMIPYQTSHGRTAYKKLKCYIGIPKEFDGKKIESIAEGKKHPIDYMTVGDVSKLLGAKFE
ncbi:MAG: 50S ribosomal protein L13 [Candidatus Thermoplasmatota archaeon]